MNKMEKFKLPEEIVICKRVVNCSFLNLTIYNYQLVDCRFLKKNKLKENICELDNEKCDRISGKIKWTI